MSDSTPDDQAGNPNQNPLLPVPPGEKWVIDQAENQRKEAEKYQRDRDEALKQATNSFKKAVNHTVFSNYVMCVLTAVMICITISQCSVTKDQLGQSERALQAAIDTSRLDQRAWVTFTKIIWDAPVVGKPLNTGIMVLNGGKTFALDVECFQSLIISDGTDAEIIAIYHEDKRKSETLKLGALFPGVPLTYPYRTRDPMIQENVSAIEGHKVKIFLIGEIFYDDVTRKRHFTRYLVELDPATNSFHARPTHNDAD